MPTYQRPRAQITITEKDENGRERVAIAVRGDPTQPNRWDLKHTLPNGQLFDGSFFGPKAEDSLALQQMLSRTENQFRADAGARRSAATARKNRAIGPLHSRFRTRRSSKQEGNQNEPLQPLGK